MTAAFIIGGVFLGGFFLCNFFGLSLVDKTQPRRNNIK